MSEIPLVLTDLHHPLATAILQGVTITNTTISVTDTESILIVGGTALGLDHQIITATITVQMTCTCIVVLAIKRQKIRRKFAYMH